MKPQNGNKDSSPNGMVLAELKHLKERLKVLEADNKLLQGRAEILNAPVVTQEEFKRCRMALLNLLVATENQYGPAPKPGQAKSNVHPNQPKGEMRKAMDAAEAIIRPVVCDSSAVVMLIDRSEEEE